MSRIATSGLKLFLFAALIFFIFYFSERVYVLFFILASMALIMSLASIVYIIFGK